MQEREVFDAGEFSSCFQIFSKLISLILQLVFCILYMLDYDNESPYILILKNLCIQNNCFKAGAALTLKYSCVMTCFKHKIMMV